MLSIELEEKQEGAEKIKSKTVANMYDSNIFEVNPKMVYMKESPPRGERIDAIVGEVHKKDHKLQMKDNQTCKIAQTQPNCLYNFLVQIMLEIGFIIKESQPSLESNTLAGFYKTKFGLAEKCRKKGFVECTGSVTGKYLSILGVLIKNDIENGESMDEDIEPLNLGLKISSYVEFNEKGYAVVKDKKRNELQTIFEDFSKKLMEISRTELGLADPKPNFNSLPSKVKEHIASFLDMKSLGRVAQVSKDLSKISSNDQLWNRFLLEAVESTGKVGNCSKEAVKYILTLRRCLKDQEKGQQKNCKTGRENMGPKFHGNSGPKFHGNWGPKFLPDGTLEPGFEINPYSTHFSPSPDARPRGEFYLPRRSSRPSRRSMYPNDGYVYLNAPGPRPDPMGLFSSEYFQNASINSHYSWQPYFPENYEMCG